MSEEERIENMKKSVNCNEDSDCECPYKLGDECLLDLYNKEKEKNKELATTIDDLKNNIAELKLEGQEPYVKAFFNSNYIPKLKVEEIIKELDKTDSKISKGLFNDDCGTWTKAIQNLLKRELLEE